MKPAVPNVPSRSPRIQPAVCTLLSNWRYVEYSLLRVIAGWGRSAQDWEDKLAVCYHTWLQADITNRLRKRLDMFPGVKVDGPVHQAFESLCNAVLLAPSFADAMAGVHEIMNTALVSVYEQYASAGHPVHDRPTYDLLHEIRHLKRIQRQWYDDFRQRHPHAVDEKYRARLESLLAGVGGLALPIEAAAPYARACGIGTGFAMSLTPGRVKGWNQAPNVMPFLQAEFSRNVEARRLYFMIGYMREMAVAEEQLRWIYYADFMPFEFILAEARHMWDESRHGDSGRARLHDFGLGIEHVVYDSNGKYGDGALPDMTPADVYQSFYRVTQVAETGFFEAKRFGFRDFAEGGDDASAEMMQFDIIDETSHVEYGRIWLEEMGRRAGIEEDYRIRGAADRAAAQRHGNARAKSYRDILGKSSPSEKPRQFKPGNTSYNPGAAPVTDVLIDAHARAHYEWLVLETRSQQPLTNAGSAAVRPNVLASAVKPGPQSGVYLA